MWSGFWFILAGLVSSELICSGPEEESCYPRIFDATYDFQRVFEGQELPGGLHVRIDLESGIKEAKLMTEKVRGPQDIFDGAVGSVLGGTNLEEAFAELEDLVHDPGYGLQLVESPVLKTMIEMLKPKADYQKEVAMVMGSALQNNAKALERCTSSNPALLDRLLNLLPRTTKDVKIKLLYLMQALLAGPGQKDAFRWFDGSKVLRGVFQVEWAGSWDGQDEVRVRIARLITDIEDPGWCGDLTAAASRMKGDERAAIEEALGVYREKYGCVQIG